MTESGSFNKLVSALSIEERHDLLEKLKSQSSFSSKILYHEEIEDVQSHDIETEYSRLPWYYHLWYFFLSFFKSTDPAKIFEDKKISILGNRIDEKTPGLYDYNKGMLLPLFYRQLVRLKEAAHFFYSALDSSFNRDRWTFFAFLGSLEMPDVHKVLQNEANPTTIAESHPELSETELRQTAFKSMEDAFAMITEEKREAMYFNARSLYCLKELSSFLYDRILMAFNTETDGSGASCSAGIVRDLLLTLNNILISLKTVPPMALLESLFIFILQEKIGEQGFEINREIRMLLSKAESCLSIIREFNNQVPLTWVLRCSTRDMALTPHELSGGEDWYAVYRDYWKRRTESLFAEYLRRHRQKELIESFRTFLKGKELKAVGNVQTESNPDGMPLKGAFALSFLLTFYSVVFMPEINMVLRSILIDGDFRKRENRNEFAEAYNNLVKLEDEIKQFAANISSTGDYYARYLQAKMDMSSPPVKRRKIQIVLEETEEDISRIIGHTRNASQSVINILTGILGKDTKEKYFPLRNLSEVMGKNSQLNIGINDVIQKFQFVLKILDDIDIMESGRKTEAHVQL